MPMGPAVELWKEREMDKTRKKCVLFFLFFFTVTCSNVGSLNTISFQ